MSKTQTRVYTAQFYLYKAPKQAKLSNGDLRTGITLGEPVVNREGVRRNLLGCENVLHTALVGSHVGVGIYIFHSPLKISSLYILNICLFYINKKVILKI